MVEEICDSFAISFLYRTGHIQDHNILLLSLPAATLAEAIIKAWKTLKMLSPDVNVIPATFSNSAVCLLFFGGLTEASIFKLWECHTKFKKALL